MSTRAWMGLALLAGCKHKAPEPPPITVAATELVAQARARPLPGPIRATYGIDVDAGKTSGSTRGAMVLSAPNQLRIDILTPLNTPLAYVASDGTALHAWVQQEGTFYRGDDAAAVLAGLLGGAVGGADAIAVLTGNLPLADAPLEAAAMDDERGMLGATFRAPEGATLTAWLGGDSAVYGLELTGADGAPLIVVDYADHEPVGEQLLPGEIDVRFPSVGWSVGLSVRSWDPLDEPPAVFSIAPPPGATEKDLLDTLEQLRAR